MRSGMPVSGVRVVFLIFYSALGKAKSAYLNQILALSLGDKRLQLWCRKGVDKTRLGNNEKEHLGASEDRKLIGLMCVLVSILYK